MDKIQPRADWERVGDRWFRRTQTYTEIFPEELDLDNYVLTGAPFGGALALWRDDTKLQAYQPGQSSKPSIDIYSLAGRKLRSIPWDKGTIKTLGWSENETLLVVTTEGNVRCYDIQGDFSHFSLGHGAEEHTVVSCQFYATGLVALLGNNTFVTVASYTEPRPKLLAKPPKGEIRSWAIVSPEHTLSRSVEVLVSVGKTVHVIDATDCDDKLIDLGPFSHVSVSPDGRFANLYGYDGRAHIISSDFQNRLFTHESDSKTPPQYVEWCGTEALIAWEDEVHIIGPGDLSSSFIYDSTRVHIISEYDGARLITNDFCEFIELVPQETQDVFGHSSSSSPASILLDALGQLEKESPKADDYIQLIRPNLTEAVDTCVNAAGREYEVYWQKRLLKAASFGKSVLDIFNSDDFVEMCDALRVLNAVRYYEVGMPLSLRQYHRLTPSMLIQRLLNRHLYLLALKIAAYLKLPANRIYVHWASAKVRLGAEDDDTICKLVVDRLDGKPGISFEEIGRAAFHEGRARLATELLNHEPRAGRQVPLLLDMKEDELALDKAIESGDTDLIIFVLRQLKKKMTLTSFFRTINTRPAATALVESSQFSSRDRTLLKDLYYQDDRRIDGASVLITEALQQPEPQLAMDKMGLASKLLVDSKEHAFELHAIKETNSLLKTQGALSNELNDSFVGLSVNETIFKLYEKGHGSKAKKVQSEFKVSDTVACWIKLRALVAKRDWPEIESMAKSKKSPIGWEPFFNLVLQAGNTKVAALFVPKCTDIEQGESITMYEKCGMPVKAAEEAVKLKDVASFDRILEAARNTPDERAIEKAGAGLRR